MLSAIYLTVLQSLNLNERRADHCEQTAFRSFTFARIWKCILWSNCFFDPAEARDCCRDYKEVDGMMVPHAMEAAWNLLSGEFKYARLQITEYKRWFDVEAKDYLLVNRRQVPSQ